MPLILELIFFDPTRNKRKSRNLRDTFSDKQFYLGLRIVEREQNKLINEDGIQSAFILNVKNTNNTGKNSLNTYINCLAEVLRIKGPTRQIMKKIPGSV